jgi:uncharacterized membrane protein
MEEEGTTRNKDSFPESLDEASSSEGKDSQHKEMVIAAGYYGPLPPASQLGQYEDILPGAADRILTMAEEQAHHRQGMEVKAGRRSWGGLVVGGILASGCIAGGIWLAANGHAAAGSTIATGTVVSLAGVFVFGTRSRK